MKLLVVALGVLLALGLSVHLVLHVLQLALHLLLGTLSSLSLLPLVLQLCLQLPDLLGERATQLLGRLLLGRQLTLVVGLGRLQVDLQGERGEGGREGGRERGRREGGEIEINKLTELLLLLIS